MKIHRQRYDLPIFLRRESIASLDDLTTAQQNAFAGAYVKGDIDGLQKLVDEYLFNVHYPSAMVKGVIDMTVSVLNNWCRDLNVESSFPYLVKDQLVYGEMISLMPIESGWCRGFMMIQIEEKDMLGLLENGNVASSIHNPDYRNVNDALGELTNLVWGSFKNRFYGIQQNTHNSTIASVPIISNHKRSYISFGTSIPQLSFEFRLVPNDKSQKEVVLYQKFIFNLNWDPHLMPEKEELVDDLVSSGELELL